MSGRIKQEKTAPVVDEARRRLDGVLQKLLEKAEESPSSSDDDSTKVSTESVTKDPSPIASTSKRIQRTQRKRRRKEEVTTYSSNTYITKIYDCSVDLAQFDEDSPLYPMCRSWIKNKPYCSASKSPDGDSQLDDKDEAKGIYQMPPPEPHPKSDDGRDPRIPSPVPQPDEKFFMASEDSQVVPVNVLLAKHQARWKVVRQKWRDVAMVNEERFKESADVILRSTENAYSQDDSSAN